MGFERESSKTIISEMNPEIISVVHLVRFCFLFIVPLALKHLPCGRFPVFMPHSKTSPQF